MRGSGCMGCVGVRLSLRGGPLVSNIKTLAFRQKRKQKQRLLVCGCWAFAASLVWKADLKLPRPQASPPSASARNGQLDQALWS